MRRALAILILFLLAAHPVDASTGRHAEWVTDPILPDVQWNASVDIGYISTAPLVTDGLVIVKGGGDPNTGEGAGLVAYRADTGTEIWRSLHVESDRGFEVAPLVKISAESEDRNSCSSSRDLVVTGWTSGLLTAHDIVDGAELWNVSTPAPNWGITGGGFQVAYGEIVWPTETGTVQVCASNGTVLNQYEDTSLRTYRANLGLWVSMESNVNQSISTSVGWLQGTESGRLLRYDNNSNLLDDTDVVALANLSGTWRIRSTPIFLMGHGTLVHLHADSTSQLLRIDWNESGPLLLDSIPLGSGTATTPPGFGYLSAIAGLDESILYGIANETIYEAIRWNSSNVVGEIQWLQWDEVNAICLPQNSAQGSWFIAIDANHSIEWVPDVQSWVTAGCGSDGMVHAVANDASWLEVRYDPLDWNSIHARSDNTLGTNDAPDDVVDDSKTESEQDAANYAIVLLPFIGAGLFFIVAQFAANVDTRRQIQLGALIMVMLGLLMAGTIYNAHIVSEPDADSSERTRVSSLLPELDEKLGENEVLVAFHFPQSYTPEGCSAGGILLQGTGESWQVNPAPDGSHCIAVSIQSIEVGDTVEGISIRSLSEYGFSVNIEQQALGPFLKDIGDATGGSDGRWWSYDLNGGYGTVGMAEQVVQPGDHIDWHFDIGQF